MKRITFAVATFMLLAAAANAADVVGGRAGAFLRAPAGVRALGLGGSYVAVADDATSLYWNAAGLASVVGTTVQISHTSMGLGRNHTLLGIAQPAGNSGLVACVLWDRFAVDDIEGRDSSGEEIGLFDDRENMLAAGVGTRLGRLSVGGAFRYYQHKLADYTGDGTGYDLGARYELRMAGYDVAFGASVCDRNGSLSWDTPSGRKDDIPTFTRAGVAIDVPLGSSSLLLAGSLHVAEDEDGFLSFGAEYALTPALQLRGGLYDDRYAAGATIRKRALAFSFALAEDVVENASYLTIGIDIER